MTFLFVFSALNLLMCSYAIRVSSRTAVSAATATSRRVALGGLLAATCYSLAVVLAFGGALLGGPEQAGRFNWCVVALFIAALLSLLTAGLRIADLKRLASGVSRSVGLGSALWAAIGSIYLAGTAVDHWVFFRDSDNAAVVYAPALVGAKDVQCDSLVLVQQHASSSTYRCPQLFVLGGQLSSYPFAPWPHYTEGESTDLNGALAATMANAKRIQ